MATYAAIYRVNYYQMLGKAAGRAMLIKSTLVKDNEKAAKSKLSTAEFESLGGAVGTLVKMKTDNIQALLNFTEILLQKCSLTWPGIWRWRILTPRIRFRRPVISTLTTIVLPRRRLPNWKRKAVQSRKTGKA